MSSPRLLAGTAATLETTVYVDGTATDPTGSPTCTVVDGLGAAVQAGAATIAGSGSGKLRFALEAADVATPRRLVATWAGVVAGGNTITLTTEHEIVSEFLFTEAEARAFDDGALESADTYSDTSILEARDLIHDAFEQILGYGLGKRWAYETLDGLGRPEVWLEAQEIRELVAVATRESGSQTWTDYSAEALADILVYPNGRLYRESLGSFPYGMRNVRVAFLRGTSPIPLELRRAGLILLRDHLVKSNIPARATSQTDGLGTFTLSVAGRPGQWFGIPEVDSRLSRLRRHIPGVG